MKTLLSFVGGFCLSFLIFQANAAELPSGYSSIPYLEGDGKAYIDTGYAPTPTTRFEALIDVQDIGGDYFLFGASDIGCYATTHAGLTVIVK